MEDDTVYLFLFRRHIHLEAQPQRISILLGRYPHSDVMRDLPECIRNHVDINHPFRIIAKFEDPDSSLEHGFRVMGRFLTFLGNKLLDFGLWQGLEIKLPDRELPFNRLNSPELPLEAFTKLRDLTWTGHPQQILNSWLPLTPSVLQNLEILTITCDMSLSDFAYLLRHLDKLRILSLKHIRRYSFSTCAAPPIKYHSRNYHSVAALEDLSVTSDEDICLVFDQFYFPSLLRLKLTLGYTTLKSDFHDLESFDWGALKRFELLSNLLDSDEPRFHTLLNSQAEFLLHDVGYRRRWTTTRSTHV